MTLIDEKTLRNCISCVLVLLQTQVSARSKSIQEKWNPFLLQLKQLLLLGFTSAECKEGAEKAYQQCKSMIVDATSVEEKLIAIRLRLIFFFVSQVGNETGKEVENESYDVMSQLLQIPEICDAIRSKYKSDILDSLNVFNTGSHQRLLADFMRIKGFLEESVGMNFEVSIDGEDIRFSGKFSKLKLHRSKVLSMVASQNKLITGAKDGTIRIWNMQSKELVATLKSHKMAVQCLLLSPTGEFLYSGSTDGTVKVWSLRTFLLLESSPAVDSGIHSLVLVENRSSTLLNTPHHVSHHVMSGDGSGMLRIWHGRSLHTVGGWKAHSDWITSIVQHGNKIITASADKTIKVWNSETRYCFQTLRAHKGFITGLGVHDDTLFSGGYDGRLYAWCLSSYQLKYSHDLGCTITALKMTNSKMFVGLLDRRIQVYHAGNFNALHSTITTPKMQCFQNSLVVHFGQVLYNSAGKSVYAHYI